MIDATRSLAHFIWVGDANIPTLYQKCIDSFHRKHPYWSIKFWRQKDIDGIIATSPYAENFNKYTSFINRYNFIKYHILAEYGGWFIDMDIQWHNYSIDAIYNDKLVDRPFPNIFVPVRTHPRAKVNHKSNDDMLIYASKGLFFDLLKYIWDREDIDSGVKYEPYGPVSLSRWLHERQDIDRVYLYENEIQEQGFYCRHLNGQSWRYS